MIDLRGTPRDLPGLCHTPDCAGRLAPNNLKWCKRHKKPTPQISPRHCVKCGQLPLHCDCLVLSEYPNALFKVDHVPS